MAKRKESDSFLSQQDRKIRNIFTANNPQYRFKERGKSLPEWRHDIRNSLTNGRFSPLHTDVAGSSFIYPSKENKIMLAKFYWELLTTLEPSGISLIKEMHKYNPDKISLDDYLILLSDLVSPFISKNDIDISAYLISKSVVGFNLNKSIHPSYSILENQCGVYLSVLLPEKYTNRSKKFKQIIPFMQAVSFLSCFLPIFTDRWKDDMFEWQYSESEDSFNQSMIDYLKIQKSHDFEESDYYVERDFDYDVTCFLNYTSENGIDIESEIIAYKQHSKHKKAVSHVLETYSNKIYQFIEKRQLEQIAESAIQLIENLRHTKYPSYISCDLKLMVLFDMIRDTLITAMRTIIDNKHICMNLIEINEGTFSDHPEMNDIILSFVQNVSRHNVILFTEHSYTDCLLNEQWDRLNNGGSDFEIPAEEHSVDYDSNFKKTLTHENVGMHKKIQEVEKTYSFTVEPLFKDMFHAYRQT